jgi:hypothetical protein
LFDDGTYYEFYTLQEDIHGTSRLNVGGYERVLAHLDTPRQDLVFATVTDKPSQLILNRAIAVGEIRKQLRTRDVNLLLLQSALDRAAAAGFELRSLYDETRAVRPGDWPEPPDLAALTAQTP